jgi:Tfp pilus assembly protein PilX
VIKRLAREEAGMTMALAIFMVVLIGVLGAGLLSFVNTDLANVVEVNRGQKALEMADAGVQAARRQLIADTDPTTKYDGGFSADSPWSYCFGLAALTCSSANVPATGSAGMTVNNGNNGAAQVTILTTGYTPASFKVVSTGCVPDCASSQAKRRVEAMFRSEPDVGFPATYFTRHNLNITGSANPSGVSFFALGNANTDNSLGTAVDGRYGRWAATSPPGDPPYPVASGPYAGSYPNDFNATLRSSQLPGLGAWGTVTGTNAVAGTRSYGSNTCPQIVQDYNTGSPTLPCTQKMAFPFDVPNAAEDKSQIDALRKQALQTETPASPRYIDSYPGNGVDDAGQPNGNLGVGTPPVSTWPAASTHSTVVFFEYETYASGNTVTYSPALAAAPCDDTAPKGAIVVQNGNAKFAANRGFNGAVIVRAYDSSGTLINTGGTFETGGTSCLRGYANSGGLMTISGNFYPSSAPTLGSLNEFKGSLQMVSWRELYQ